MSEPVWVPLGAAPAIPWQIVFTALANEPPAVAFATLDTRNGHPVLDFDAAASEYAIFRGVLPSAYSGRGLNVKLIWAATTAVTGIAIWIVDIERINAGGLDIDADSFSGGGFSLVGAANAVSGMTTETVITVPAGSMDGLLAGELFRLRAQRSGAHASDTMAGDAELLAVVITEL